MIGDTRWRILISCRMFIFSKITTVIDRSRKKNLLSFLVFWSITILLYYDTRNAGFVTDFIGWKQHFNNNTFLSVINGDANHIKSFYQFTHLLMYLITAIVGLHAFPWFIIFSLFFSLNAFLFFLIFIKIFSDLKLPNYFPIALTGVLMFMLSPYQVEVMVWRASFHYLTSFAMMLTIVYLLLLYIDNSHPKYWVWSLIIFLFSVFALEFFLFTPFVVLVFILFQWINFPTRFNLTKLLLRFVYLPLLIIVGYFLLYKITYNKWIAHYGVQSHIQLFSPESFAAYAKYLVKYIGFARYYDYSIKNILFFFLDIPVLTWWITAGLVAFCATGLVFFKKMTIRNRLIFFSISVFFMLLIPVITLYFSYILLSENDRLGYMASAFLFMAFSLLLSYLPRKFFYLFSATFILISTGLTIKTNGLWKNSEILFASIVKNGIWKNINQPVLFLNVPDNLQGVPMFRTWDNDVPSVAEAINVYGKKKQLSYPIIEVGKYNITSPDNGVHVKMISDAEIIVVFNQWGNWWWNEGRGASDYETENFRVEFNYKGCGNCYKLTLKNKKDRVLIFQNQDNLIKVDTSRMGEEQW